MSTIKSASQLTEDIADPEQQRTYLEFCNLMDLLANCVITANYHISDELNEAIALSKAGSAVVDKLQRKSGVPVKEARLMCALTIGHVDLFVDLDRLSMEKLETAVDEQLRAGEIRFPFHFGRELYDAFAARFDEEKVDLTVEETQSLLDDLPIGVVQFGHYVTGPFGLRKSQEYRILGSSRSVPAFHCSDPICNRVHLTRLETSQEAPINKHRSELGKVLDEESPQASEWWTLAEQIAGDKDAFFADTAGASLVALIGDALSADESRALLAALIDSKRSGLRKVASDLVGSGKSSDLASGFTSAERLQLMLLCREAQIGSELDRLVRNGTIVVPEGEIRRPVTNARARSGAFRLAAELGHHGVRFVSTDPGLPSLRLRRLLKSLYVKGLADDYAELDWQLRGFDAEDIDERLEEFFRTVEPEGALRRLVLARRTNMIAACEETGLDDGAKLDDETLIAALLWKLGFDQRVVEDENAGFWKLQERITALTRSSRISGIGDSETFRGVASNYFVALEGALVESLMFATWALVHDHAASQSPFVYSPTEHHPWATAQLQQMYDESDAHDEDIRFDAPIGIYPLARGFAVLADGLASFENRSVEFERATDAFPDFRGRTTLKEFVFAHTVPYLDLTDGARSGLRAGLSTVSKELLTAEVNAVRNDYSHYRRTEPEIQKMERALDAARKAVLKLEELGLTRLSMWPDEVVGDAWGRSHHRFVGPRGAEQLFARPTAFDWMGMPGLDRPQYLVKGAKFAEPNEILRFTLRLDSDYDRTWAGFPNRRKKAEEILSKSEGSVQHLDGIAIQGSTV